MLQGQIVSIQYYRNCSHGHYCKIKVSQIMKMFMWEVGSPLETLQWNTSLSAEKLKSFNQGQVTLGHGDWRLKTLTQDVNKSGKNFQMIKIRFSSLPAHENPILLLIPLGCRGIWHIYHERNWQIGEIFGVGPFEGRYVPESQRSWHPELIYVVHIDSMEGHNMKFHS